MEVNHFSQLVNHLSKNFPKMNLQDWEAKKDYDIKTFGPLIHKLSKGLLSIGLNKSNTVAVFAKESIHWILFDLSILSIGGISVPVHYKSPEKRCLKVFNDIECRFAVVSSDKEIQTILNIREQLPHLLKIISFHDSKIEDEKIISFEQLIELGENLSEESLENRQKNLTATDFATITYSSGEDDNAVVLSHEQLLHSIQSLSPFLKNNTNNNSFQSLPLSHIYGRSFFYSCLYSGLNPFLSDKDDFTSDALKTINPAIIFTRPDFIKSHIIEDLRNSFDFFQPLKEITNIAIETALEYVQLKENNESIPFVLKLKYLLFQKSLLNILKKRLGANLKLIVSIDYPINKSLIHFLEILNIPYIEAYGLNEFSGITHLKDNNNSFKALDKQLEMKLSSDNELLLRSNYRMIGYYQNEILMKEKINHQNWFSTDDYIKGNPDSFEYYASKNTIVKLNSNKSINLIETEIELHDFDYIHQVIAFAREEEDYISVLINPNKNRILQFAQRNKLIDIEYDELCQKKEILQIFQDYIDNLNIANAVQVKYFALIIEPFSIENGLLSDTGKVKRNLIGQKYKKILDQFFEKRFN